MRFFIFSGHAVGSNSTNAVVGCDAHLESFIQNPVKQTLGERLRIVDERAKSEESGRKS
jgi:hypothetical protein